MNAVFMGTPDFAVPSLRMLAACNDISLSAVICQPDKPSGRKMLLTPPAVKSAALELGIEVFQPSTLRDDAAYSLITSLEPDVIIVAAYGKILPKRIIDFPKYGCINIHGSLLPNYRGAAPIQRAVIDGQKVSGITIMRMDDGIDTGDIIVSREVKIGNDETAGELFERLSVIGSEMIIPAVKSVAAGTATFTKQDDSLSSYASMLSKGEALIDWSQADTSVFNLVRGMNPWPVAFTRLDGKLLKVFRCKPAGECNGKPGEAVPSEEGILVCCGNGRAVCLTEVQLEGSRRMSACELTRGRKLEIGTILKG